MTVPHVLELAGVSRDQVDEFRLPAVESIDALEELLGSTKVEAAVDLLEETLREDPSRCVEHGEMIRKGYSPIHCKFAHPPEYRAWREECAEAWRAVSRAANGQPEIRASIHAQRAALMARQFLSDERPISQVPDCIDWRGHWLNETTGNNALMEFWRGKYLLAKAKALGDRQRAREALRARVAALEPLALDYARRALIDPLNAALEAALER